MLYFEEYDNCDIHHCSTCSYCREYGYDGNYHNQEYVSCDTYCKDEFDNRCCICLKCEYRYECETDDRNYRGIF